MIPAPQFVLGAVFGRITEIVAEHAGMPVQAITAQTTIGSLGLDSLEIAQLVISLEDALNVDLEHADFGRLTTLQDLFAWITNESAKP